ncbi:CocE/NonD family hydrolase [Nocardioides coralli]|uniref:CocE/NonD family hydrolase n=1 Tax=Nocardioides coralli TaxID=2872154 RepID=UPI001CA4467F|nr:CocE/NonD family hydrolase [Nocardioides coralli]QZY30583.1 hypothetical protein K6T13_08050 [Nocardioides coralli]
MPHRRRRHRRAAAVTSTAAVLAGLLAVVPGSPGAQADPTPAPRRGEAWVTVPSVDSDHDGRDDRVHVRWRLPRAAEGPVPVVVEPSPYFAGLRDVRMHDVDVAALRRRTARPWSSYRDWLLPEGYAYVTAESLGSGGSTGCPTSGGRNETAAMTAVVRWLTGDLVGRGTDGGPVTAAWSTGRVGMIGVSYNGTLPQATATSGVEGLDAVVGVSAISSWYDYYRSQGMVRAPGGYQGEDADVLARAVLTRNRPGRCREEIASLRRRQARRTGDLTPFWQARDYRAAAHQVSAGVLTLHGTADDNVFSDQAGRWAEALAATGAPVRSWWHPYGHGDWLADHQPWRDQVLAWFDHFLRDADNGVLAATPASTLVTRAGRSRSTTAWPGGEPTTLWAGPVRRHEGRLRTSPAAGGVGGLVDDARHTLTRLARTPRSRHRLLWRSPRLVRPVDLSGHGSVDVRFSVDAEAANVSVGLVTLGHRHGQPVRLVSGGWADPRNHASLAQESPLRPGEVYELSVELDQALVRRVPAGVRLGLVVASSDHAHTLRPPAGTRVRVRVAGTRLVLPVVGGPGALAVALGGAG